MNKRKFLIFTCLILAVVVLSWGIDQAWAQPKDPKPKNKVMEKRLQQQALQAAAKAARARGVKPGKAGTGLAAATPFTDIQGPGGIPHYFGPYGNWAFSPLPKGNLNSVVTVDAGGTGYSTTTLPTVTITDAYDGTITDTGTATVGGPLNGITGITVTSTNVYTAPVVTISDPLGIGTGAAASATLNMATVSGGMPKFMDKLPGLGNSSASTNALGQFIPVAVPGTFTSPAPANQIADSYEIALVEYEEKLSSSLPKTRLRGYVQIVPCTTPAWQGTDVFGNVYTAVPLDTANGLTQNILINGVQACGATKPHYLGPVIVAQGRVAGLPQTNSAFAPKPVRITFRNLLPPTATGGDLFLPVDETVTGSGVGPSTPVSIPGEKYTQNRATVHLHGNNTVWISDGNTHQWITPKDENTAYPAGVSARNVPDMGTGCDAVAGTGLPGNPLTRTGSSGCQTFFYTNAQSARLQFYHDHAMGITRLNVYAGEAAGYVLTDAVESDLISGSNKTGVNIDPATGLPCTAGASSGCAKVLPGYGIPLVIQDKTFVDANTVFAQDPTWNWGTTAKTNGVITTANTGDLWYPHVYMVVSNPYDVSGMNAFGKWFYGPWFNPPTPVCVNGLPVGCIEVGLVPNEYADPANPGYSPSEPPMRPGTPNPSIPGESFMDTPLVNGTAYPYVEVPAGPVRFRVLNANNDRGLNLQLYKAFDKTYFTYGTGSASPGTVPLVNPCPAQPSGDGPNVCTEVRMVPVYMNPANQFADTPSGVPDPTQAGPPWIQIGTEGGFTPAPVVVPQQPIGFNMNTGQFNFSIVNQHSLYLQPAERADVIVDFSLLDGQTFILYNDAPAPIPAGAAVYDFYTGNGDQTGSGGAPSTLPGYGPNTRTIMQIRVKGTAPASDYNLANLLKVWKKTGTKRGVFEVSQDPTIIPQAAYNTAYEATLPSNASQFVLSPGDFSKTFNPLQYSGGTWSQQTTPVTIPLEMKAMHDEMGGVYDTLFGRMSGMLGLTNPALPGMMPFPFMSPPTDLVKGSLEGTKIGELADGTQLWRIFHNGVDTHPIHVHLFTAQLINRVGQDGQVADGTLAVDPNDVGWKETFKVNPLEITFLALRPTVPSVSQVPFEVPNSVRLIDPTLPEGATLPPPGPAGWFDPATNAIPEILNHYVNFGWEYVWHCHILSHEEMDFMHSLVFAVPPIAPVLNTVATSVPGPSPQPIVTLTWADNSTTEPQFTIQRASDANFTTGLRTFVVPSPTPPNTTGTRTYTDTTVSNNTQYWYRVFANGAIAGEVSLANFPTMSADSVSDSMSVQVGAVQTLPAAPTALTATAQAGPQVSLTWRDNANNETGFYILRCDGTCTPTVRIATAPAKNGTGNTTYVDTTVAWGTTYSYQVFAVNGTGVQPTGTLVVTVPVPAIPAAPASLTVSVVKATGNNYTATLNWTLAPGAPNPTNFTIQRAQNLDFTTNLNTSTVAGNLTTTTQTIQKNTTYYYRIKANNNLGGGSKWTNALPFPIRTGP